MMFSIVHLFGFVWIHLCFIAGQSSHAQYFIGEFYREEYPLAIDTCNPTTLGSSAVYQKASCIDEKTVMRTTYYDATCNDSNIASTRYFNESYQTGLGTLYDFNCDDTSDPSLYVTIEFGMSTCNTTTKWILNTVIGVCTYRENDDININIYCENNYATLTFYDIQNSVVNNTGICDDSSLIYKIGNATNQCGLMFVRDSGFKIFGKVLHCGTVAMAPSATPTTIPTMYPNSDDVASVAVAYNINHYFIPTCILFIYLAFC